MPDIVDEFTAAMEDEFYHVDNGTMISNFVDHRLDTCYCI
jgi:hypothetical protein